MSLVRFIKDNSITILTVLSSIGVVTTSTLIAQETIKASKQLNEAKTEKGSNLTAIEVIEIVGPTYIPGLLMGTATISCIFGANNISKKTEAALLSSYQLLNEYHKQYRGKVIKKCGKEIDEEIRGEIEMSREISTYHRIGLDVPDQKVYFYDETSGQTILRYEREIMDAEYHLNRNYVLRGCASLNEFYQFLGLPETEYGEQNGWSQSDGIYWIDFEHRLITRDDGGTPIYAIDMVFPPCDGYMREWE